MIDVKKYLKNDVGRYILSILLGLGFATFFRNVCKGTDCVVFNAPKIKDYENKIYKYNNKCYKYETVATKCDSSKKIIEFA
jgi:hypothetical protein